MPERAGYDHGVPCWVDLGSPDLDASIAFYRALFGWGAMPAGTVQETGGYGFFTLGDRLVCGYGPLPDESVPAAWSTYVAVADADEIAQRVGGAGGETILPPMDVGAAGRMAFFSDPGGAAIGVWQAGEHKGAQVVSEPGAFVWNELMSRDSDRAEAFYRDVFGWSAEAGMLDNDAYAVWKLGDVAVGGMLPMGDEFPPEVPSHWMTYFAVGDCDEAAERCAGLGGTVSIPPTNETVGRFAILGDPHGAYFSVIALAGGDG